MVADRFRLRYKLTPEHYTTFAKLAVKRLKKPRTWKSYLLPVPFGIVLAVLLGLVKQTPYLSHGESRILLVGMAIGVVLVFLFYLVLLKSMKARSMVGAHDAMVGEFTLAAYDGGGLQVSGEHVQSSYDWTAFIDLTSGPGLLILWLDRSAGVIIPTSAFADDEEQLEFVDFVAERIEAHRQES